VRHHASGEVSSALKGQGQVVGAAIDQSGRLAQACATIDPAEEMPGALPVPLLVLCRS
jgi:hypothetical protein